MAIEFAIPRFLSRSKVESSVHTAAYNMREPIYDERLGEIDDPWDKSTHVSHDIDLPPVAAEEYKAAGPLWNHVEASEGRIDSQVAFEVVVALDPTLTDAERRAQAREFARERFVNHGFAAQIDVHRPHPSKAIDEHSNYHAHILVPTRPFYGPRLAKIKPRDFFVKVKTAYGKPYVAAKNKWGPLWRDFQNKWFSEHGKPTTVDPVAPVPQQHIGPRRFRHPQDPRISENAKRQEMNATLARDPQSVAEHLGKHQRFDGRTLERFVARHVKDPVERQIIQAETLPKLAALQRAALIKASQADMTASGLRRLSVEDVAREISPPYAGVLTKTAALRDEARDVDRAIRQATASVTAGESRTEQRRQTISLSRKLLHSTGIYTDPEIDRGLVQQKRGAGWRAKLRIKEKRIEHQLAALFTQATAELEKVRPEAQRELETRQRIARNARAQLQVVEKADRTLRVRRTPTLRP